MVHRMPPCVAAPTSTRWAAATTLAVPGRRARRHAAGRRPRHLAGAGRAVRRRPAALPGAPARPRAAAGAGGARRRRRRAGRRARLVRAPRRAAAASTSRRRPRPATRAYAGAARPAGRRALRRRGRLPVGRRAGLPRRLALGAARRRRRSPTSSSTGRPLASPPTSPSCRTLAEAAGAPDDGAASARCSTPRRRSGTWPRRDRRADREPGRRGCGTAAPTRPRQRCAHPFVRGLGRRHAAAAGVPGLRRAGRGVPRVLRARLRARRSPRSPDRADPRGLRRPDRRRARRAAAARGLRRALGVEPRRGRAAAGDGRLHRLPARDGGARRDSGRTCAAMAPCMRLYAHLGAPLDATPPGRTASGCAPTPTRLRGARRARSRACSTGTRRRPPAGAGPTGGRWTSSSAFFAAALAEPGPRRLELSKQVLPAGRPARRCPPRPAPAARRRRGPARPRPRPRRPAPRAVRRRVSPAASTAGPQRRHAAAVSSARSAAAGPRRRPAAARRPAAPVRCPRRRHRSSSAASRPGTQQVGGRALVAVAVRAATYSPVLLPK